MGDTKNDTDEGQATKNQWHTIPGKEGILYREHPTRKNGRVPDKCLSIRYRAGGGKRVHESLGWTSDGWSVPKAVALLREIKENIRIGARPQSLREKRAMAEAARKEEQRAASRAKLKEITFSELAEYYRAWANKNRVSSGHVSQLLDMHILPELGERCAYDITPDDINRLRDILAQKRPMTGRGKNKKDATLAAGTVLHALKVVREVYNFALETVAPDEPGVMLFTGTNPARMTKRGRGVRLPAYDSRRLRILNEDEVKALLNYQGRRSAYAEIHDMLLFSLDTGVRAGELVNLKRESVDPKNGTIRVLKGAKGSERSTKGGETRVIHAGQLHPECLQMLRERLGAPSSSPYLFPGVDGSIRDANGMNRIMRRIMAKLHWNDGVDDARNLVVWHTLRHTFATRMLESGVDIYILKELMGHSSVTTTEIYLHLCNIEKRKAALARIAMAKAPSSKKRAGVRAASRLVRTDPAQPGQGD